MEIESVVLVDGTKFMVGEVRFGGTVKRIYPHENGTKIIALVAKTNSVDKYVHIPYHSILFYIEEK